MCLQRWPGVLLLLLLLLLPMLAIAVAGRRHYNVVHARLKSFNLRMYHRKDITGGASSSGDNDFIDGDGEIGNPLKYPENTCEQPNYLSKHGKIFAVADNGTEVAIDIKGVNWFGMETYVRLAYQFGSLDSANATQLRSGQAIVFGLWDNATAATTAVSDG
jgi:endoglucanase